MKTLLSITMITMMTLLSCSTASTRAGSDISSIFDSEIRSDYSKRYDLVERLYAQALDEDQELKTFNDKLNGIHELEQEQMEKFDEVNSLYSNFRADFGSHISRLQDTTLRKVAGAYIEGFSKLTDPEQDDSSKLAKLHQLRTELGDYKTLLKLSVASEQMEKYLLEEHPGDGSIDQTIELYEKLIQRSKGMTTTQAKVDA